MNTFSSSCILYRSLSLTLHLLLSLSCLSDPTTSQSNDIRSRQMHKVRKEEQQSKSSVREHQNSKSHDVNLQSVGFTMVVSQRRSQCYKNKQRFLILLQMLCWFVIKRNETSSYIQECTIKLELVLQAGHKYKRNFPITIIFLIVFPLYCYSNFLLKLVRLLEDKRILVLKYSTICF